jgi:hypothetical protein
MFNCEGSRALDLGQELCAQSRDPTVVIRHGPEQLLLGRAKKPNARQRRSLRAFSKTSDAGTASISPRR